MKVHLFVPCFVDQLYPEAAFNTVKVLERAGCMVKYNVDQTCCGQPAFNAVISLSVILLMQIM
jgi:L-lactate dehydrogenase complex protein LldE